MFGSLFCCVNVSVIRHTRFTFDSWYSIHPLVTCREKKKFKQNLWCWCATNYTIWATRNGEYIVTTCLVVTVLMQLSSQPPPPPPNPTSVSSNDSSTCCHHVGDSEKNCNSTTLLQSRSETIEGQGTATASTTANASSSHLEVAPSSSAGLPRSISDTKIRQGRPNLTLPLPSVTSLMHFKVAPLNIAPYSC